jgi:hypothetical protein
MNRSIAVCALLACLGFAPSLEARHRKVTMTKESAADMSSMRKIFLGWVGLPADDWKRLEYGGKEEWVAVINRLNRAFQQDFSANLTGRTVTAAKSSADQDAAGQDLAIKFSDARIDYDNYLLYVSIHFLDPKTNTEIAVVPVRGYYGDAWGLDGYLEVALKEVGRRIQTEITGVASTR